MSTEARALEGVRIAAMPYTPIVGRLIETSTLEAARVVMRTAVIEGQRMGGVHCHDGKWGVIIYEEDGKIDH